MGMAWGWHGVVVGGAGNKSLATHQSSGRLASPKGVVLSDGGVGAQSGVMGRTVDRLTTLPGSELENPYAQSRDCGGSGGWEERACQHAVSSGIVPSALFGWRGRLNMAHSNTDDQPRNSSCIWLPYTRRAIDSERPWEMSAERRGSSRLLRVGGRRGGGGVLLPALGPFEPSRANLRTRGRSGRRQAPDRLTRRLQAQVMGSARFRARPRRSVRRERSEAVDGAQCVWSSHVAAWLTWRQGGPGGVSPESRRHGIRRSL